MILMLIVITTAIITLIALEHLNMLPKNSRNGNKRWGQVGLLTDSLVCKCFMCKQNSQNKTNEDSVIT